jgi:hypothetical protein
MAFIPVPDCAQVEIVFSVESQIVENVRFYQGTDLSGTSLAALVEAVNAAIRDQLLPLLHSSLSLIRVVGQIIDAVDGIVYTSTTSLPAAGGAGGTSLPNNVAMCVSLRTAQAGRSFRGRNYICGIPSAQRSTNNLLESSFVSDVIDAWTTVGLAAVDDGWVPVVVSRFHDGAPRTTGVATEITSTIATDNIIDSQRRRLPGRGA